MKLYETLDSGIKIVEYEHSLAEGLAEFWNICGQEEDGDWGGDSGISSASQIIAQHDAASYYNVYIALDGDAVVGYCSFGRYYYDANTLYVALLGVRPDYRSKKIGKALVLLCVQRTIELGYPRLDLFTWGGNTAAVPLYKKCGFLWEDRTDGTHLANFMPTILTTPLFADFFKRADWYNDSKRNLDIVPDGVKVNGFEFFGYDWEKDGETLKIGYERSGRQMRMIETNDYKIELTTPEHELAYGTDYACTFAIENKTGKPLDIKIKGRADKNITLTCDYSQQITGKQEVSAKFYVGPVDEPQDDWKAYPCLLADVEINGQAVTFGLGINSKFPLTAKLTRECKIDQIGMNARTYIDIQSALLEDAKITVKIPKGKILDIKENILTADVKAKGKASFPITATTQKIGYEKLELACIATFASGTEITFTAPLFIQTRDMTHAFYAEDLTSNTIYNGPWSFTLSRTENEFKVGHLTNSEYSCWHDFASPKLGKPYDDEFNLIKPSVKAYNQDGAMVMEVEFVSEKFAGLVVTQFYTLFAGGFLTHTNKVENRGDKPRKAMLQFASWINYGLNTTYSLNGKITQNHDRQNPGGSLEGLDNIASEDLDENWVFEDSRTAPRGYIWPKEYKPTIQWGAGLLFDIDLGELKPGQDFVTKPVYYAMGLFANFNDLRNYALQIYNQDPAHTVKPMEIVANGYNPFTQTSEIKVDIINNRDEVQEGEISVTANGVTKTQTNPHEDIVKQNNFDIAVSAEPLQLVDVNLSMVGYEKTDTRAIFQPNGKTTTTMDGTSYNVSNGALTIKLDPNYSQGCYSLTDVKGQEWLLNQYPEHKPFSWFNPFLGGIRSRMETLDDRAILKEEITAEFTELKDNFGNMWQGICSTLTIKEDDKLKGAVYKYYYLTQPGVPVICTFYQLLNKTGEYKSDRQWISIALKPDEDAKNVVLDTIDKDGGKHRYRMGSLEVEDVYFEGTIKVSSSRTEKLYGLCRDDNTDEKNEFWGTNRFTAMVTFADTHVRVANGETYTSSPAFLVITEKDLPQGALDDLRRIEFIVI